MKSKMKRRMLAIVLCMVIVLSNSSFIFASSESGTPAVEAASTEGTTSQTETDTQGTETTPQTLAVSESTPAPTDEPAAPTSVEATPTPTDTPEVTTTPEPTGTPTPEATPTPTDTPETTTTPEPTDTPEITTTPQPTDAPETTTTPEPTDTPEATPTPTQGPENGTSDTVQPTETPTPTEAPVKSNEAVELKQEFKDSDGNVTSTVKAQIPEGTFAADASEITMEVQTPDTASAEHVKEMMEELLPENHMLGDYIFYDIQFKVNGTVTEPQKPITIIFEGEKLSVKDVKRANVFWLDPEDPQVDGDKDQLVEITQKSEMIENLQNSGQSTENIDDYDLSEITLKEDGISDKIQMEGRTSTIYGCYVVYEPVQVLAYDDDQVTVTVSAAEEGIIPANAELKVVPITAEDKNTEDQYKEVEQKLQEKAEEDAYDIAGFLAYDITFVDEDGNETEPGGEVKVSIDYKEAAIPETISEEDAANAEVTVLHLEEDEKGEVKEVVDMAQDEKVDVLATTEENKVEKVEVRTESFSTFTITWESDRSQKSITVYRVNEAGTEISLSNGDRETSIRIDAGEWVNLRDYAYNVDLEGYTYVGAHLNSYQGTEADQICAEYRNRSWNFYYSSNNQQHEWTDRYGERSVYLVYKQYNGYEEDEPETVGTIDSTSKGINMRMIDFPQAAFSGASWGTTQHDAYGVKQGILSRTLNDNGYPTLQRSVDLINDEESTITSALGSFQNMYRNATAANNLFLESVYTDTGYFYYNSGENAAVYDSDSKSFTVYKQLMTPRYDENNFFYNRGNFLPYNTFDDMVKSLNRNQYDEQGNLLDENDPRRGEYLYVPDEPSRGSDQDRNNNTNYEFGMELSADFVMTEDGKIDQTEAIRYEFTGDDDLWVYIDGVLVLDMGGCHDARSGYIDFSTGEVWIQGVGSTTIREQFRLAGYSNDDLDEIFEKVEGTDNYIFKDYTNHTFKMWYMERGQGASNLKIKFNLPVVPAGQIEIMKKLSDETDPVKFGDVRFGFELYVQDYTLDENGNPVFSAQESYTKMTQSEMVRRGYSTVYSATGNPIEIDKDGVFYLKPTESVQVNGIPDTAKYYVVEVDVDSEEYDEVTISNAEIEEIYEDDTSDTIHSYVSSKDTVDNRYSVVFINSCSAKNLRTLRIDKEMEEGQISNGTFKVMVQLEGIDGELHPYSGNYWLYNDNTQGGENQPSGEEKTTNNGVIELKADQYVCIYNIISETEFSVNEIELESNYGAPSYKVSTDGGTHYSNGNTGVIQLDKHAYVIITNKYKASITVKKQWADLNDTNRPNEIFVGLFEKTGNGLEGREWKRLTANEDWSATFVGYDPSAIKNYYVYELRPINEGETADFSDIGYIRVEPDETIYLTEKNNIKIKYTVGYENNIITSSEPEQVIITNTQCWQIVKRSTSELNGIHPILSGAVFELSNFEHKYYGQSEENGVVKWYQNYNSDTAEVEGEEINSIANGTYSLKEIKAPDGYSCGGEWTIVIENGLPKGITGTLGEDETTEQIQGVSFTCYLKDGVITVYYDNTPLYNLPSAGSSGIFGYMMGGTLLLMAGTLILYKMKRKEVQES